LDRLAQATSSTRASVIRNGAMLTPAMGALSGVAGIQRAMSIAVICFGIVLAFALRVTREARI
jgi:fucose permease